MGELKNLVWLIPILPAIGFVINVFLGRRLHKFVSSGIACATVGVSAVIAWAAFFELRATGVAITTEPVLWFFTADGPMKLLVEHKLHIDQLTSVMILVVTNVGFLIHVYSVGYMADEKRYSRYFSYLNLFTGFMLLLVMSANALGMFIGWEGVGLCSYLLIGFWYEKEENASAGMKAFVVNRVGDLCFTIGLLTLFVSLGRETGVWTVDFQAIAKTIASHPDLHLPLTFVGIMLFLGATGKSAQIPLYTWLPDAMAGPTPVSALIHAATMVTAGVYMIARFNFLYSLAPGALTFVAVIGAATALFAGTIGLAQNDIKKVLAYSTVSQLGFMFVGVGTGAYFAGIFHLMTHAFFKACLFLGSGSVIHGMGGEQDIRKMGGLKKYMPITFWTFAIASYAICGLPFAAGFFSKDEILWRAFSTQVLLIPGPLLWLVLAVAAACTAFYMTRLVILTFFGELRSAPAAHAHMGGGHGDDAGHGHDDPGRGHGDSAHGHGHGHAGVPHESPLSMTIPLMVLAGLSIIGGFIGLPHIIAHNRFEEWLEPVCPVATTGEVHHMAAEAAGAAAAPLSGGAWSDGWAWGLMIFSTAVAIASVWAGWLVYGKGKGAKAKEFAERNRELYELVRDKYRVDELYQGAVVEPLLAVNESLAVFDNTVVDGAVNGAAEAGAGTSLYTGYFDNEVVDGAVNAAADATQAGGRTVRRIQTGNIRAYVLAAVVGGLVVIAFYCVALWFKGGAIQRLFGG